MLLTDDDFLPLLGTGILGQTAGKGLPPPPPHPPPPNGIAVAGDDVISDELFLKAMFDPRPFVAPFALATSLLGVTLRLQFLSFHGDCGPPSPVTASCSTLPMATPAILIGTLLSPVLSLTSFVAGGGGGGSDPPRNSRSFIADDFTS